MKRLILLAIIVIGMVSMVSKYHAKIDKQKPKQMIYTVKMQQTQTPLYFSGIIKPYHITNISSPIDGVVNNMHFQYGQAITKGQILFNITSSKLQTVFQDTLSNYLKTWNDYNDKNRQYQASIKLRKLGFISDDDFYGKKNARDEAYMSLVEQQTKLTEILSQLGLSTDLTTYQHMSREQVTELLTKQWNDIAIKAPVSGIALAPIDDEGDNKNKMLTTGDQIKQDQALVAIGDVQHLTIVVNVSELDIARIHTGLTAKITSPAFADIQLTGTITNVDEQGISDGTNLPTFPVTISINQLTPAAQKAVHVGMDAKVEIDLTANNVIQVPISAVYQKQGQTLVNVINDNKIKPIIVEAGETSLNSVIIKQGLKPGDQVVYTR